MYERFDVLFEDIHKYEVLIENKKEKNVFDVAGFPHYENVASNLLSFFLDTEEEHGKKDKWLRALLRAYVKKKPSEIDDVQFLDEPLNVIYTNREEKTQNGKYIDIVVETENLAVAIENKLYARDYNDFSEYRDYIHKTYQKKNVLILLSLNALDDHDGFINITYSDFLYEIRNTTLNNLEKGKWDMMEADFITNLEKRSNADITVDTNWIKYSNRHKDELNFLLNKFRNEVDVKHNYLQCVLDNYNTNKETYDKFEFHGKSKWESYQSMYKDYSSERTKDRVTFEPFFMNTPLDSHYDNRLYYAIWVRDEINRNRLIQEIRSYFEGLCFSPMIDKSHSDWGNYIILGYDDFSDVNKTISNIIEIDEMIRKGIEYQWKPE